MSVLIRNMEMPKSCCECPLLDWDLDYIKCKATGRHFNANEETFQEKRVDDCPLLATGERTKFEREVYTIVKESQQGNEIMMDAPRWSGLYRLGKDGNVKTYETLQKARQGLSYLQNANRKSSEGARIARVLETVEVLDFEEHVADHKERLKRAKLPLYYAGRIPVEFGGIPAKTFCSIKTTPCEDFQEFVIDVYHGEKYEFNDEFKMNRDEFEKFKENVLTKLL